MTEATLGTSSSGTLLLAALRFELAATVRRLGLSWQSNSSGYGLCAAGVVREEPVFAALTGVGGAQAAARARRLVREHRVRRVIHLGFAGGLDPVHRAGEVLRFACVCDGEGRRLPLEAEASGMLLSVDRLVATAAEKRTLHERCGASAVDMETFAVAQALATEGFTFIAVRAISDPADLSLPPAVLEWIDPYGRPSVAQSLGWLMRHPGQGSVLYRLARDSRRAARALAGAIERLI